MKSRGLVTAVALILALTATMAVYLYVQGVRDSAEGGADSISVVVAKQDIPTGTRMNDLLDSGGFEMKSFSEDAVIVGAITNLEELRDAETAAPILEGEQVTSARIKGTGELPGGSLGIPNGMQAITIAIDSSRAVGGAILKGDHVTVYATFDVEGSGPRTVVLVPDVQVLNVDAEIFSSDPSTPSAPEVGASIPMTFALSPVDAQRVIYAQERGSLYLALNPPNSKGKTQPPVDLEKVISQ